MRGGGYIMHTDAQVHFNRDTPSLHVTVYRANGAWWFQTISFFVHTHTSQQAGRQKSKGQSPIQQAAQWQTECCCMKKI